MDGNFGNVTAVVFHFFARYANTLSHLLDFPELDAASYFDI